MVLGVFTTFRVLGFCDMTVDGSFPLGACVLAALLMRGANPAVALIVVALSGIVAGIITATIHAKLHVPDLLSGILTMTMLYSVNLRIMGGRANVSFLRIDTAISKITSAAKNFAAASGMADGVAENFSAWCVAGFLLAVVLVIKFVLDLFFHTDLGLTMGALGSNKQMVISQGVNPQAVTLVGICMGNALAAISGAFAAMYGGFADVGSGTGVVVSGLASLMLGEFLLKSNKIAIQTLRVICGSIIYRALMYLGRSYGYKIGMTANDLRLLTGLLIIVCLVISGFDFGAWVKKRISNS